MWPKDIETFSFESLNDFEWLDGVILYTPTRSRIIAQGHCWLESDCSGVIILRSKRLLFHIPVLFFAQALSEGDRDWKMEDNIERLELCHAYNSIFVRVQKKIWSG